MKLTRGLAIDERPRASGTYENLHSAARYCVTML